MLSSHNVTHTQHTFCAGACQGLQCNSVNDGAISWRFAVVEGMPLQTVAAKGVRGSVEIEPISMAVLKGLAAFSYLNLLTHLHQLSGYSSEVTPYLDDQPHGVF